MAGRPKEGGEMQTNERMKTRETMGASGNTKKRRKCLLVVSAEEQYAGGDMKVENDSKRKRMSATKPRSH